MAFWVTSKFKRKRSSLAVILVSVLLVGYVGFLVGMNYLWQLRLRESNLEKAIYKIQEYAAVSRYFFSERKEDLRNLSESREIAAFFENKALGMSMDYGLKASLLIICRSLKEFASNRKIDEHRIYTRIAFIDRSGNLLVDTSENGKRTGSHRDWSTLLHPNKQEPEVLVIEDESLPEIVVSAPYYFKDQYAGQIVAWISTYAACHLIEPPHRNLQPPIHIVYNGHFFPPRPQTLPEALPEPLRELGKLKAGKFYPFYLPGPGGSRLKMLAASYPIQGPPLSLLAVSMASDILGTQAPWKIPLGTGILAVFILGGAALIFRITAKNAILKTRLEEAARTGKEIEDKNRELETEIAYRTEAEESLRREKAISDALAEISNAILLASSIEEISSIVLEHATALTGSKIGYVGYIDSDTGYLVCPTLIGKVWERCRVKDKAVVFKDFTGLWGWVLNNRKPLMTNAPTSDPRASGTPKGHIPVTRFLSVPALLKENLLGQVSVANAEQDYKEEDIRTLEKLSALYAIAIQRRLDERLLQKATIELEQTVRERTAELTSTTESLMAEMEEREAAEKELVESEKRIRHLIEADPGQIQQVIMNLVVNAKDAMPMGGKITIQTANVNLDESYAHDHALGSQLKAGPYVTLSLSDTGIGMNRETREQIFEPFFTTKEKGKGTGLGLSTVYGIVKQSGGYIWCYSEPGKGTTFKIYLPTVNDDGGKAQKRKARQSLPKGSETILVVEDNESLRNLAIRILKKQGYTVLEARDGAHALDVCNKYEGSIELLLSDVVMPGMTGDELQMHVKKMHPGIKVVLMSGYMDDALAKHGVSADKTAFIQKPFTPESLAKKVREVLDSGIDD